MIATPVEAKHKPVPASSVAPVSANGPSADYPVVLGESYSVGSTVFTPSDTMNLDAVGYASAGSDNGGNGGGGMVSAAHHTMPIPSYAEVTSLDSGRTIVVRVDRRGPMDAANLIELSPAAAAQLGLGSDHGGNARNAVRVRRVNPPEPERALLRAGAQAPERMPTPKALLAVLARKLDPDSTVILARAGAPAQARPEPQADVAPETYAGPPSAPRPAPAMAGGSLARSPKAATSDTALPRLLAHGGAAPRPQVAVTAPAPDPAKPSAPARKPARAGGGFAFGAAFSGPGAAYAGIGGDLAAAPPAPARIAAAPKPRVAKPADIVAEAPVAQTGEAIRSGMLVVQAGAFAVKGNAQSVAARLGASVDGAGKVSASGKVWRVRVGPYASRVQAEAPLAKVHAAGYSEARIQRAE